MEDVSKVFEKINELALEYECDLSTVYNSFLKIKEYPFIMDSPVEQLVYCLEILVNDRISEEFVASYKDSQYIPKSFDYSLSDALYRVYEDKALPYLSPEYLEVNFSIKPKKKRKKKM